MVWLLMRFLVSSDGFVVLRNFDINWSSIQIIHAKRLGGLTSYVQCSMGLYIGRFYFQRDKGKSRHIFRMDGQFS